MGLWLFISPLSLKLSKASSCCFSNKDKIKRKANLFFLGRESDKETGLWCPLSGLLVTYTRGDSDTHITGGLASSSVK